MKNIFLFSGIYLPTFPYLEFPLYYKLIDLGLNVTYVLQDGDIRLTSTDLYKKFSKLNLKTISEPKYIADDKLTKRGDIIVSRFAYKGVEGDVATYAKKFRRLVFQYDPSGIDIRVRQSPAHYLTAKSKELKRATLKKFPNAYRNIFTTGSIHYDAAATTEVNRTEFMKSYGLNPNKKLAILTPANPGEAWMKGLQEDYKQIVKIVKEKCPTYEIAIKCHPLDYLAKTPSQPGIVYKNQHYNGKHSWEVIAPNCPVIKAEEGYMALKASDVILNIRSSIAMESCLFKKPIININRDKYITNWPFDSKIMTDAEMGELEALLNTNVYTFNKDNIKYCKDYAKKHCFSNDGKAYERIANAILKVARGEI